MSDMTDYGKDIQIDILENMKSGYFEMGKINSFLSEEGFYLDLENLENYENKLVESE